MFGFGGAMEGVISSSRQSPDLSPHETFPVEWWFIQGYFEGKRLGRRNFMTALFRAGNSTNARTADPGAMLLVSTLDPAIGRHTYHSRISPAIIANYRDMARQFGNARFSPLLANTVVNGHLKDALADIDAGRVQLDGHEPSFSAYPFRFQWNGFSFRQHDGMVDLDFALPGNEPACSFRLSPRTPWMNEQDISLNNHGPVAYVVCPRLEIAGTAGDEEVSGRAWIDHQWGGYIGWLMADHNDDYHPIGWDWFGVNLDDGTDLLLMVYRHVNTNKTIANLAYIFEEDRVVRPQQGFSVRPTGYWRSPHTAQKYPVAWRIDIPQAQIGLDFTPRSLDQEIPVFGMNAIWEGAGCVTGTHKGRPVTGEARLELHGYGYVLTLRDFLARRLKRFFNRHRPAFVAKDRFSRTVQICDRN